NGNLTFTNMQTGWGIDQGSVSAGAVYADLDNDGDLDLVVNNINQDAFVYRNMSREHDHTSYLPVKLEGVGKNTAAIGAKVYVYANGMKQYEEMDPARGYLSCMPGELHFGLGKATVVDSAVIIWPDGSGQTLRNVTANQLLTVKEGAEKIMVKDGLPIGPTIFHAESPLIDYHQDGFGDNDFKRQLLMLFMYSRTGPVLAKADIDKDGREDLFISGGKTAPGRVYLQ